MIYISEPAKNKVLDILKTEGKSEAESFVRVSVVGGGCSGLSYQMSFDNGLKKDDQVFEDRGLKLVCDMRSFLYLCGTTLDHSDGLNGKGFHFVNPNATRTCACGESFAV